MMRGHWVTEEVIKGNVNVPTLRMRNLKLRETARNLAKTLFCLINTFPPPRSFVWLLLACPGCLLMGAFPGYSDKACVPSALPN